MHDVNLTKLNTEQQNERTLAIDTFSTAEILAVINQEDQKVALAVKEALLNIEELVEVIVDRLTKGGRLVYIGAGSSGLLAYSDAIECPPTYGISFDKILAFTAEDLLPFCEAEAAAEDNCEKAIADLTGCSLSGGDVLVAIAASGRTPYALAALQYGKEVGCYCGAISCVKDSAMSRIADTAIEVITGPEVITGSTRMKAGTAQKMVLNMLSTASMIRMGKVYDNLMVDMMPINEKLVKRAKTIITRITGCELAVAEDYYQRAAGNTKIASLMILTGLNKEETEALLADNGDHLKKALQAFSE